MKLCPECLDLGISSQVETYHGSPLEYCTFHYWLMRGMLFFPLEVYVNSSERYGFATSLPTPEEMQKMIADSTSRPRPKERPADDRR